MGLVHSSGLTVEYRLSQGEDIIVTKWILSEHTDSTDPEFNLSELVATGHTFCHKVDTLPADSIFIEKEVAYEFLVKREFSNLKIVGCCELDFEGYSQFELGKTLNIPNDLARHEVPVSHLAIGRQKISHKVYVSKDFSKRVISLFLIDASTAKIIIMARCLLMRNEEFTHMDQIYGAEETIAERSSRVKRLVSELQDRTFFRIYSDQHLERAILATQSVSFPDINYWITDNGDKALAYRFYKAAGDKPVASFILIATDSYFIGPMAHQLSTKHSIDVYVCHPRGFGPSEGIRGYSESPGSIWSDIAVFIRMTKLNGRLKSPTFLGGHFWAASMALKYCVHEKKNLEELDGLVLVAPNLGREMFRKEFTERLKKENSAEFHISPLRYLCWRLSGGRIGGKKAVLRLQSDPLMKELDPTIVDNVSLNTLESWRFRGKRVKNRIPFPSIVLIGSEDEFFEAKEVLSKFPLSERSELTGEDSLTIIPACVEQVASWIHKNSENKEKKIESDSKTIFLSGKKRNLIKLKQLTEELGNFIILTDHVKTDYDCSFYLCESAHFYLAIRYLSKNYPKQKIILHTDSLKESELRNLAGMISGVITSLSHQTIDIPVFNPNDQALNDKLKELCKKPDRSTSERAGPIPREFNLTAYEPIELIGKGSFGTVWLARVLVSGKPVAIKQVPKALIDKSPPQLSSIKSEVEILTKLRDDHPFIVTLLNHGQDSTNIYLVEEFIPGGELFTRMQRVGGKLSEREAKFFVSEIAFALHTLHQSGFIYRDLKPENVLISASSHVKLVDFGFARELAVGERVNDFCGSPFYIAPEMLTSSAYDSSIDWWALGILTFEMLTGQPPFLGTSPREVYRSILVGEIDWSLLKSNYGNSNQELVTFVKGLLKNDTETRYRFAQVRESAWLQDIDWNRVESRSIDFPFPLLPPLTRAILSNIGKMRRFSVQIPK
jgi:protein kinase A